eukprot:SAG22_NODE_9560_length_583_cov_0.907025_1_plen_75_part_10
MLQAQGNTAVDSIGVIEQREGASVRRAGHTESYYDEDHGHHNGVQPRFSGTAYIHLHKTTSDFDVDAGKPGSTIG